MGGLAQRLRVSLGALHNVAASGDLRRLQLAYLGSELGAWVAMIGLSVVAYSDAGLTGFGVVLALRMLPPMLAAPFMGVLADRLRRRRVMIASDVLSLVLMLVAAGLVFAGGPLALILALLSIVSIAGTAFRPAQAALLPQLAKTPEELTAANAVSSTIESVTAFAGPALGGVLVAATEPGYAFLFAAATFLWSAALVRGVREPARETDAAETVWSPRAILDELADGGRALVGDRGVAFMVGLIGVQVVVSGVLLVLLAGLAFEVLGTGEDGYGWLLSGLGVGGLVGAVVALGLTGLDLVRSFAAGVALWGIPIALLAAWQSPAGAFVLVAVVGLANTLVDVSAFTLLQRAVPDDVLARVFGILESVLYAATMVGALAAPGLAELLGLDAALVVTGLALPLIVVASWPVLRRMRLTPTAETELELLKGVPFLALLGPSALEHLAGTMERVTVPAGVEVFAQGDDGDRFYVVAEGDVAVRADERVVHEGGAGYYFGEIALLRDAPRMATVTATSDLTAYALGRAEFIGAVTGHSASAEAADAVVSSRLRASRPVLVRL